MHATTYSKCLKLINKSIFFKVLHVRKRQYSHTPLIRPLKGRTLSNKLSRSLTGYKLLHNSLDAKIVLKWTSTIYDPNRGTVALGTSTCCQLQGFIFKKRKVYYSTQLIMKCPRQQDCLSMGVCRLGKKQVSVFLITVCSYQAG